MFSYYLMEIRYPPLSYGEIISTIILWKKQKDLGKEQKEDEEPAEEQISKFREVGRVSK